MLEAFVSGVVIVTFLGLIVFAYKAIFHIKSYFFPDSKVENIEDKEKLLLKKYHSLIGTKHKNMLESREILSINVYPPWSKGGKWKIEGTLKGTIMSAGVEDTTTIKKISDTEVDELLQKF
tara:strand:+ start:1455 stop:1817 length:363 start_codon:yes stop_codon:yes gene_type:complete